MKILTFFAILVILVQAACFSQQKMDKGIITDKKNRFFDEILESIKEFEKPDSVEKKIFKVDFSEMDIPKSVSEFKTTWFNEPVSQGNTNTCWSFSTTSFLETEAYRINNVKVRLSDVFTVYWEYIEKAKRFISERGNSAFAEGSESDAVTRIWKDYGIVPLEVYSGMKPGQKFLNHSIMYDEMNKYLTSVKSSNAWNEEEVIGTIKSILNHYMGTPPAEFTFEGKKYTPKEFLKKYVKINPDDYVAVLSLKQEPYWKQAIYKVPDNWWLSPNYYNVPLDDFMNAIKNAIKNGYTLAIGGDVSEAGYDGEHNAAIVPTFDIPSEYINEDARQFRFSNGTTQDDHGLHLVGYKEKDGKFWFLIKDSASSSRNGHEKGYYFYHEDYVKLKTIDFLVHKDAVKDLLEHFKNN